jgi:hypothetical protein
LIVHKRLAAIAPHQHLPAVWDPLEWVLGGDAALEKPADPAQGLGTSNYGISWRVDFDFDARLREQHITVLEPIIGGAVLVVYAPLLPTAPSFILESDALATSLFMSGKAGSCRLWSPSTRLSRRHPPTSR